MAGDYEGMFDLDGMTDDEVQGLVRQLLQEYDTIDADNVLARVRDGVLHVSGRVGTESERRIVDHVITDVVGLREFVNDLVVDPIRRDTEPEAADDHLADVEARGEDQLGGTDAINTEPTAEHLEHQDPESLNARLYGTHDVGRAIREGTSYEPPDTPTPEGLGDDADSRAMGEDH